jgi:hypothetical protein
MNWTAAGKAGLCVLGAFLWLGTWAIADRFGVLLWWFIGHLAVMWSVFAFFLFYMMFTYENENKEEAKLVVTEKKTVEDGL